MGRIPVLQFEGFLPAEHHDKAHRQNYEHRCKLGRKDIRQKFPESKRIPYLPLDVVQLECSGIYLHGSDFHHERIERKRVHGAVRAVSLH